MKILYHDLQIEITRRCTGECKHCCRGDQQNLDLTKEEIDALINYNDIHSVNRLLFSGGNPPLNGEMLEYTVDSFIKRNIPIYSFMLSMNGLDYNEAFVRGLNKLNEYCGTFSKRKHSHNGLLFISQSQFHKKAIPAIVEKYEGLPYFSSLTEMQVIPADHILPYGNAIKNQLTTKQPNIEEITDYNRDIKIIEYENEHFLVFDYQYISSNGNILCNACMSYDMMDKYMIGNVKDGSMIEIYKDQPKMKSLSI